MEPTECAAIQILPRLRWRRKFQVIMNMCVWKSSEEKGFLWENAFNEWQVFRGSNAHLIGGQKAPFKKNIAYTTESVISKYLHVFLTYSSRFIYFWF